MNPMSAFDRVLDAARSNIRRVVLPEAGDARVLSAAVEARLRRIADPILLGNPDHIQAAAAELEL